MSWCLSVAALIGERLPGHAVSTHTADIGKLNMFAALRSLVLRRLIRASFFISTWKRSGFQPTAADSSLSIQVTQIDGKTPKLEHLPLCSHDTQERNTFHPITLLCTLTCRLQTSNSPATEATRSDRPSVPHLPSTDMTDENAASASSEMEVKKCPEAPLPNHEFLGSANRSHHVESHGQLPALT